MKERGKMLESLLHVNKVSRREEKEEERLIAISDFASLAETFLIPRDEHIGYLLVESLQNLATGGATYKDAFWVMFGAADTLCPYRKLQGHIILLASQEFVRLLEESFSRTIKGEECTKNIFGTELWEMRTRIDDSFKIDSVGHPHTFPMRLIRKKLRALLHSIYKELIIAAVSKKELEGLKRKIEYEFDSKCRAYQMWYQKYIYSNLPRIRDGIF